MARLVLSDASPLVGLARVDGVPWLRALFGVVSVTRQVEMELGGRATLEPAIAEAMNDGWLRVLDRPVHDREASGGPADGVRPPHLGDGEWSTILAAKNHHGPALILLDDRLARREAGAMGLQVAGTAAVIVMANRRGLLSSPAAVFERLLQSDIRISPQVIRSALEACQVGENQ
jgi:predicted nucleic acid-binding protein